MQEQEDFPRVYYVVYGFAAFTLVVGTWCTVFPFSESSIVGSILGMWGVVTGLFLILNADLFVTFLRLRREMGRMRKENQQYRAHLKQQKRSINHLRQLEKAFARMGQHLQGRMEAFDNEMKELVNSAKDGARSIIDGILLISRPKQSDVRAGEDLKGVTQNIADIYARPFPDIHARFQAMMRGLAESPRWQKVQSMSTHRLKWVLERVLFEDTSKIQGVVRDLSEEEERTVSDLAGSFVTGGQLEEDDPWADAEAFVEGQ